jgi:hypothetical protein
MAVLDTPALVRDVLWRAGEPTSATSEFYERCLDYLNRAELTVAAGAQEFDPGLTWPWRWHKAVMPAVIILEPAWAATVTVTHGSLTATITSPPAGAPRDLATEMFTAPALTAWPRVASMDLTRTVIAWDAPWVDQSGSVTGAFWRLDYALPSDVIRVLDPVRAFQQSSSNYGRCKEVTGLDRLQMERQYPLRSLGTGPPDAYAVIAERTLRFNRPAHAPFRVEADYMQVPPVLYDAPESIPREPVEYRHVLADIALYFLLVDKDDARAAEAGLAARNRLQAMRRREQTMGTQIASDFGALQTRQAMSRGYGYGIGSTVEGGGGSGPQGPPGPTGPMGPQGPTGTLDIAPWSIEPQAVADSQLGITSSVTGQGVTITEQGELMAPGGLIFGTVPSVPLWSMRTTANGRMVIDSQPEGYPAVHFTEGGGFWIDGDFGIAMNAWTYAWSYDLATDIGEITGVSRFDGPTHTLRFGGTPPPADPTAVVPLAQVAFDVPISLAVPLAAVSGGVPAGGAINAVLSKSSATDYATAWTTAPTLTGLTVTGAATAQGGLTVWNTLTLRQGQDKIVDSAGGQMAYPTASIYYMCRDKNTYFNDLSGVAYFWGNVQLRSTVSVTGAMTLTVPLAPASGGVPTGGTANQVLAKVDATNHNLQWVTPGAASNGVPAGGATNAILAKTSATDFAMAWTTTPTLTDLSIVDTTTPVLIQQRTGGSPPIAWYTQIHSNGSLVIGRATDPDQYNLALSGGSRGIAVGGDLSGTTMTSNGMLTANAGLTVTTGTAVFNQTSGTTEFMRGLILANNTGLLMRTAAGTTPNMLILSSADHLSFGPDLPAGKALFVGNTAMAYASFICPLRMPDSVGSHRETLRLNTADDQLYVGAGLASGKHVIVGTATSGLTVPGEIQAATITSKNAVRAAATINGATGAIGNGHGFTSGTRTTVGTYRLTLTSAATTAIICANVIGAQPLMCATQQVSTTQIDVFVYGYTGVLGDAWFNITVVGF